MHSGVITDPETLFAITGIPSTGQKGKRCTTDLPTEVLHKMYGLCRLYKKERSFGDDISIGANNITRFIKTAESDEREVWALIPNQSYKIITTVRVNMPYNVIGYVFPRSSATRSHLSINCGIIDPGFTGTIIGLMRTSDSKVLIEKGFSLLQLVLCRLDSSVEPYNGIYQE